MKPTNIEGEFLQLRTELRNTALAVRKEMPEPYRAHKSALICTELKEAFKFTLALTGVPVAEARVAVYAAFPEEVQLHDFIEFLYEQGARVAFPCMISDARSVNTVSQRMEMREVSAQAYYQHGIDFLLHPLKTYKHASPELASFEYVPADKLTLIVVPVVAFDKDNNRLGYGGGNYDRYLTQLSPSCRKIGVAFAEQQVDFVPAESHDISLPMLSL